MQFGSKLFNKDCVRIILIVLAIIYLIYFAFTRLFSSAVSEIVVSDEVSGNVVPIKLHTIVYPFQNPKLPLPERVGDLLNRLTIEEVVDQSIAVYTRPTPAIDRLGIKPFVWMSECLHGQFYTYGTSFPQAIGLSSTFSDALVFDVAAAIATEVRANWNEKRKHGMFRTFYGPNCFSPVVNIMRHPYWGRNQETYGEDPYLSGKMGQNFIKGMQGNHQTYIKVSAGCKHFDGHGGPENIPSNRYSFNSEISTRDWRMTYLPAFKMCVEAGSSSLMCSYNSINGVPACAHKELLTDITRGEWGFKGFIVSDAHAISNIKDHFGYAKTNTDAALKALRAGCNLELGTELYSLHLDAIRAGQLKESVVRENIKPLLTTRFKLGEFDPMTGNPYELISKADIQTKEHQELATKAAMMSFVLLKNVGSALPLQKEYYNKSIAVVGPFSNNKRRMNGNWSPKVSLERSKSILDGLSQLSSRVKHADGCKNPSCRSLTQHELDSAVKGADVVVVCLGLSSEEEKEGSDRRSLSLPGKQLDLLKHVVKSANGVKVVVLLFNAGPVDLTWAQSDPGVSAIIECFYPGQMAGKAVYRVLTNTGANSVPAGRLTATWPASEEQIPPMTNYSMEGRTYRYFRGDPLYSFGYGLSYTKFQYSDVTVSPSSITSQQKSNVKVTVAVKNIGDYDADEVVQCYLEWESSVVPAPKYQLVGYIRITLTKDQVKSAEIEFSSDQMSLWIDDTIQWQIPKGKHKIYVGGQQPNQKNLVDSIVLESSVTVS